MHNLVGGVFKVLGFSIILMAILDTSLVAIDTVTVHNKIVAMSNVVQNEIARNNCVPNSISDLFVNQLKAIENQSAIANKITSNIKTDLSEANVGEYGDVKELHISAEMHPTKITGVGQAKNGAMLEKRGGYTYTLNYNYYVPCLRFLK